MSNIEIHTRKLFKFDSFSLKNSQGKLKTKPLDVLKRLNKSVIVEGLSMNWDPYKCEGRKFFERLRSTRDKLEPYAPFREYMLIRLIDRCGYIPKRLFPEPFFTSSERPLRKEDYDWFADNFLVDMTYINSLFRKVAWTFSYDDHNKEPLYEGKPRRSTTTLEGSPIDGDGPGIIRPDSSYSKMFPNLKIKSLSYEIAKRDRTESILDHSYVNNDDNYVKRTFYAEDLFDLERMYRLYELRLRSLGWINYDTSGGYKYRPLMLV